MMQDRGIERVVPGYDKCDNHGGDYVENYRHFNLEYTADHNCIYMII